MFTNVLDEIRSHIEGPLSECEKILNLVVKKSPETIRDALTYTLSSGGKRIRAMLVLITSKLLGDITEKHIDLASVVEMVHHSTLIHDDVIDNASIRRGRDSVNKIWGNRVAILAGDYLLSRFMHKLITDIGDDWVTKRLLSISSRLCEGEVMEIRNLNNVDLTESEYLRIVENKTAQFFGSAISSSAYLSGADERVVEAFYRFGLNIGFGFQIIDDLLDICGGDGFGKERFKDLKEGNITLPLIYLINNNEDHYRENVVGFLTSRNEKCLKKIYEDAERTGVLEMAKKRAEEFCERAIREIKNMGLKGEINELLSRLSLWLVNREA
ncbi:MAG: polyprenyl synthetase family protein [bacterium]